MATVLGGIVDVETGARGFALSGRDEFLEPATAAEANLPLHLRRLRDLTADNATQQPRVADLERLVAERLAFSRRIQSARRERGLEAVGTLVTAGEGKRVTAAIRSVIAEMRSEEESLLLQRKRPAD